MKSRRLLAGLALFAWLAGAQAQAAPAPAFAQAPVEVRVPQPPRPTAGSDGVTHLAYELHVGNFYKDTGTLILRRVSVYGDDGAAPLASFVDAQVNDLLAHPADVARGGVPIEGGARVVLFLWLDLPASARPPRVLRHQLEFRPPSGPEQLVDGVRTPVDAAPPIVIGRLSGWPSRASRTTPSATASTGAPWPAQSAFLDSVSVSRTARTACPAPSSPKKSMA
ncbi:MAG: hypothetical protein JF591_21295 [Lysobacter sp.]|nr:hypothetical protein [Lysobacter sp.]